MKFRTLGLGLLALIVTAPAAKADTVLSLFRTGRNQASDEDREYLIDRVFTVTGQLDVGDSLRATFNMNTINSGGANLGGNTPNNEWTGIAQGIIKSKVTAGGITTFTIAPDPAFEAVFGRGALVVFYEGVVHNSALDFDDPAPATPPGGIDDGTPGRTVPPSSADVSVGPYLTEEAFVATNTDGTRFWTLGFTGGTDPGDGLTLPGAGEGWVSVSLGLGDNILNAFTFSSATAGNQFNVGLSKLVNLVPETGDSVAVTPTTAGAFGPVEFAFTGNVRGVADLDTPFEASSDFTVAFNVAQAVVPEPSSIMLLTLGSTLLGIGARRRIRRQG
jgi:hypothetical protein